MRAGLFCCVDFGFPFGWVTQRIPRMARGLCLKTVRDGSEAPRQGYVLGVGA